MRKTERKRTGRDATSRSQGRCWDAGTRLTAEKRGEEPAWAKAWNPDRTPYGVGSRGGESRLRGE